MMNTFQNGVLTLQRLRTGGRQTVVVQHVHLESGAQAVVGVQTGTVPQGHYPMTRPARSMATTSTKREPCGPAVKFTG